MSAHPGRVRDREDHVERLPLGDGVVVYRGVPIMDSAEQRGYAYLHVRGSPRDAPSYQLRAYLGDVDVTATAGPSHPAFAGEATTYNSPPPRGGRAASAVPNRPA